MTIPATGLAHAFDAQWTDLARSRMIQPAYARDQTGTRHGVIHEARGQHLSRSVVIDHVLAEYLPRALHDAAVQLTLDNVVIDDDSAVIDGAV